MYVLASMMLLMAIGVSAITAASMNIGAGIVHRNRTQLDLYAGSLERTIKSELDKPEFNATVLDSAGTLSGRILRAALVNAIANDIFDHEWFFTNNRSERRYDVSNTFSITLDDIAFLDSVDVRYEEIEIITDLRVTVSRYERFRPAGGTDREGNVLLFPIYAEPMQALITGSITIRQTTIYDPDNWSLIPGGIDSEISTTSFITYNLSPINIEEVGNFPKDFEIEAGTPLADSGRDFIPTILLMRFNNPPVDESWWTVKSYEKFGS